MKLLADENIHCQIVANLRAEGHDVIYISEDFPSVMDEIVLDLANGNDAILITADKEFRRTHLSPVTDPPRNRAC